MHLIEYEIISDENFIEKELIVKRCHKIESNHAPTACLFLQNY